MKKKLSIIGRGTAGTQAVIYFLHYCPDWEIFWYFDPEIMPQSVGEGSTLSLPKNLFTCLDFNYQDLDLIDSTFKSGIYKSGWGNNKNNFLHQFPPPQVSLHFNAVALQNYIFEKVKDRVTIVTENVNANNIDSDFIMDCSGKPNSYDKFVKASQIPVNAAYITQCYWEYPRFQYTLTIARPYGWVFGIPLKNRCSIGYLYNRNINSEEDIKLDVQNIFDEYNLIPSQNTNSLKFENYYRKQNFEERIAYNGNTSFFLEPLEATSIEFMNLIFGYSYDLWNNYIDIQTVNNEYKKVINQIQTVIMLHYFAGSIYDTNFWQHAQKSGQDRIVNAIRYDQNFYVMLSKAMKHKNTNMHPFDGDYGTWWTGSFSQNIFGLGIENSLLQIFQDI